VSQRISHAEMSQLDHFEGWRVVKLGHLDEWAGLMPTAMGLPIKSADRIRTQPSPFRPSRTAVRKFGCRIAWFDDRIRTQPSIPPIKRAVVRRNGMCVRRRDGGVAKVGGSGLQWAPKTIAFTNGSASIRPTWDPCSSIHHSPPGAHEQNGTKPTPDCKNGPKRDF